MNLPAAEPPPPKGGFWVEDPTANKTGTFFRIDILKKA
jgi:hypothetical protein